MDKGRIIYLNGVTSSGKTSIFLSAAADPAGRPSGPYRD